jgi:hypothetical protein
MLKLPSKSFTDIQKFLKENEVLVYRYMVLSISKAIRNKENKTDLFSFGGRGENVAIVRPKDYETVINDAIVHFTKAEEYEYAAFARDVLQKWQIEQLINGNKHQE